MLVFFSICRYSYLQTQIEGRGVGAFVNHSKIWVNVARVPSTSYARFNNPRAIIC